MLQTTAKRVRISRGPFRNEGRIAFGIREEDDNGQFHFLPLATVWKQKVERGGTRVKNPLYEELAKLENGDVIQATDDSPALTLRHYSSQDKDGNWHNNWVIEDVGTLPAQEEDADDDS